MMPSLKDWFDVNQIKNKPVKFGATILILLLITVVIGFLISQSVRYFTGSYTNVFGWEPNGSEKTDTVRVTTVIKPDTVYLASSTTISPLNNPNEIKRGTDSKVKYVIPTVNKGTVDTVAKQQTTVTGDNAHVVSGNNNQVGVNGDVINGVKQRRLTNAVFSNILYQLPAKNKSVHITILMAISGGKETYNYANEIYQNLIASGYHNINGGNWLDPDGYDRVNVDKKNDTLYHILVRPTSNVTE